MALVVYFLPATENPYVNSFQALCKVRAGHSRNTEPVKYVAVEPTLQNAILAKTGPNALANAPKDRKIPMTVPFSWSLPYSEARVIIHETTMAVAINKKKYSDIKKSTHTYISHIKTIQDIKLSVHVLVRHK